MAKTPKVERNKHIEADFLLFLLLLFLLAFNTPASAAIYRLEIRQVAPDGSVYSVLCDDKKGTCEIEIPFLSTDPEVQGEVLPIQAGIVLDTYNAYIQFKWQGGYLYMRPEEDGELHMPGYPSGEAKRIRLHVSPDRKPLTELEIKFMPDIPPPPDMPRMPVPPAKKQPI